MKLLVIGLGSMGKRRIGLLSKHFPGIQICGVDLRTDRRREMNALYPINLYEEMDTAIREERPDAALICTSPESHAPILLKCIRNGLHIFCEINLMRDSYEEIMQAAEENNVKLFLSSTLLYRKEIQLIRDFVQNQDLRVNYHYHVGQYLPDWHPWDNDRDFFAWNKNTNGCREIFAIDLPWILRVFGSVKDMTVIKGNMTKLKIQYPDHYIVLFQHENGNKGVLAADVVSRKAVRELTVYSENLYLVWNGTPDSLCQYDIEKKSMEPIEAYQDTDHDSKYADFIIEDAYLDELSTFLDKITEKQNKERYTFQEDLLTQKLMDQIEGSVQ